MAGLVPGQMLEGTVYQVVREIGAGGMGVVYEVEHVRLRKRYVAKIIHEQIRGEDDAARRMDREARVLAELNHPNVVQVHDVGTTSDGTSYFVMEKLEGVDLRRAMKRGGITPARALSICIDILEALAYVHTRGIVHRDIKPENVFLARMANGSTTTKVLDFGIVHIFDGDRSSQARITKTGGFVGTLYYAAPEQMLGKPAGPANDVYACGLVLFELLTSRGPFDDDPGVGLSRCFKPAPRLPESAGIPAEIADAVAAALVQEPEQRPTAKALATMLREVLQTLPTDPGPHSVEAHVEDLLSNISSVGETGTSLATKAPATPLMADAPRANTTPIVPSAAVTTPPATPLPGALAQSVVPYAATLGSLGAPARTEVPPVDTSAGVTSSVVTSSVVTAPPVSKGAWAGALLAAVAIIATLAVGGVSVFRARFSAPSAAAVSAPPPIVTADALVIAHAPEPVVAAAPASVSVTPAPEPVASAASSATTSAPAAAKPAARPTKHTNAEKDGYFNDL